jgi:hypothetical protein
MVADLVAAARTLEQHTEELSRYGYGVSCHLIIMGAASVARWCCTWIPMLPDAVHMYGVRHGRTGLWTAKHIEPVYVDLLLQTLTGHYMTKKPLEEVLVCMHAAAFLQLCGSIAAGITTVDACR